MTDLLTRANIPNLTSVLLSIPLLRRLQREFFASAAR
jgi:hypothetical protein